jgi:hypothetical protein
MRTMRKEEWEIAATTKRDTTRIWISMTLVQNLRQSHVESILLTPSTDSTHFSSGELVLVPVPRDQHSTKTNAYFAWSCAFLCCGILLSTSVVSSGMQVLIHQTHYHDQLLRDMGLSRLRKGNIASEYLMSPYEPADYDGIMSGEATV